LYVVNVVSRWVRTVGLGIWIGGMVMIGAIVAPVAFHHAGMNRIHAGEFVGLCLSRFNAASYVAGALLILAEIAEARFALSAATRERRLRTLRFGCAAGLLGIAVYLGMDLMPAMLAEKAAGRMAEFDAGHHLYEAASQVQLLLAFASALLTAMIDSKLALLRPDAEKRVTEDLEAVR
jgi:hypothetical protein